MTFSERQGHWKWFQIVEVDDRYELTKLETNWFINIEVQGKPVEEVHPPSPSPLPPPLPLFPPITKVRLSRLIVRTVYKQQYTGFCTDWLRTSRKNYARKSGSSVGLWLLLQVKVIKTGILLNQLSIIYAHTKLKRNVTEAWMQANIKLNFYGICYKLTYLTISPMHIIILLNKIHMSLKLSACQRRTLDFSQSMYNFVRKSVYKFLLSWIIVTLSEDYVHQNWYWLIEFSSVYSYTQSAGQVHCNWYQTVEI